MFDITQQDLLAVQFRFPGGVVVGITRTHFHEVGFNRAEFSCRWKIQTDALADFRKIMQHLRGAEFTGKLPGFDGSQAKHYTKGKQHHHDDQDRGGYGSKLFSAAHFFQDPVMSGSKNDHQNRGQKHWDQEPDHHLEK